MSSRTTNVKECQATTNGIKAVRKFCSECGNTITTGSNFLNFRIPFSDKTEKYTVCERCRGKRN